jgi:hypothetical protein
MSRMSSRLYFSCLKLLVLICCLYRSTLQPATTLKIFLRLSFWILGLAILGSPLYLGRIRVDLILAEVRDGCFEIVFAIFLRLELFSGLVVGLDEPMG